jgi:hypothetical protein
METVATTVTFTSYSVCMFRFLCFNKSFGKGSRWCGSWCLTAVQLGWGQVVRRCGETVLSFEAFGAILPRLRALWDAGDPKKQCAG